MKYQIQRALVFNDEVFNIDDYIVVNNKVVTTLKGIYFVDEYSAKIVTSDGEFLLDEVKSLYKFHLM